MYVDMFDMFDSRILQKKQCCSTLLPKYHNRLLPLTAGVSRDICQGVFRQQGNEVLILHITRGPRGELEDQHLEWLGRARSRSQLVNQLEDQDEQHWGIARKHKQQQERLVMWDEWEISHLWLVKRNKLIFNFGHRISIYYLTILNYPPLTLINPF